MFGRLVHYIFDAEVVDFASLLSNNGNSNLIAGRLQY